MSETKDIEQRVVDAIAKVAVANPQFAANFTDQKREQQLEVAIADTANSNQPTNHLP
jgi:hypothetical protein